MADPGYLDRLVRELMDKGLLVEAGWVAMRKSLLPPGTTPAQLEDLRTAYMAGAQHLWAAIMSASGFDPDGEPTEGDLKRMLLIERELNLWRDQMVKRYPHIEWAWKTGTQQ